MNRNRQNTITLVLGGARSGKSNLAQRLAEDLWPHPLYLATAEVLDDEMADRVKLHRKNRGRRWRCMEEPLEIARALGRKVRDCDGVLVDCLTLWLTNVLLKEGDKACERRKRALIAALRRRKNNVILISNEVGMGIVPDNALGRKFRDLAGLLNQDVAQEADTVVLVAAGLPLLLKGTWPEKARR